MVSNFEDTLLRCSRGNGRIRAVLFGALNEHERRQLRGVSRTFYDLVDHAPDELFRHIFLTAPWPEHQDSSTLKALAPFCHNLTITTGSEEPAPDTAPKSWLKRKVRLSDPSPSNAPEAPKGSARQRWNDIRNALKSIASTRGSPTGSPTATVRGSTSSIQSSLFSTQRPASEPLAASKPQLDWAELLSRFRQLRSVVIRTYGDPAWPSRTEVEAALVTLRAALESSRFAHLQTMRLAPMHATGIIHLRWSGFGAFGQITNTNHHVWQYLNTLDIQLHNPFTAGRKLSDAQQTMFKKLLHDYIRSFARTLRRLRFVWLDEEGPSPIALDMDEALVGTRQPIIWHALEELWLGNITLPHQTIRLLPERTMRSVGLKMMRSTHRHSRMMFEDQDAWVEIVLGTRRSVEGPKVLSRTSSVYSQ